MINKEIEDVLFRVFNTLVNFENDEAIDEFHETQILQENKDYKMITSKELMETCNKYNIDIE